MEHRTVSSVSHIYERVGLAVIAHTLQEKVKDLVLKSNRFNDDDINALANVAVDEIDIEAIRQRAIDLVENKDGAAVGHDAEWAAMLLQSIKTLVTLEEIAKAEARQKRHSDKIGKAPLGRFDVPS